MFAEVSEQLSSWAVPMTIFLAEMAVVTVGTLRIIFVSRGRKYLAPVLGFFEILIWLFAISQVMQNLNHTPCFLAFALGFTTGNFLGICIEGRLALGMVVVRIITPPDCRKLVEHLRAANYGVTCIEGTGARGPVQIVLTVIKRKQLTAVREMINTYHPNAFYSVDDLQTATDGIFPSQQGRMPSFLPSTMKWLRWKRDGIAIMEEKKQPVSALGNLH